MSNLNKDNVLSHSLCSVKQMTEVVIGALTGVVALVNFLQAEDTPKMFCLLFSEDQARRHKMCLPVIGNDSLHPG